MKSKQEINEIIALLKQDYPLAYCELTYEKDYELLFATRLSAQCTDKRVNLITPVLFSKYPSLQSLADANIDDVGQIIHSCGFYRTKAKDIVLASAMLLTEFDGKVPDNMDDLLKLPGVGRKTANLILGDIYGQPAIVVDTHCIRLVNKIGLASGKDPEKLEYALKEIIPAEEQSDFCHRLVLHGRAVCVARRPQCENCSIRMYCDEYTSKDQDA